MNRLFQIKGRLDKKIYLIIAVVSFVAFISLWEILSTFGIVSPNFLPTPVEVAKNMILKLSNQSFGEDVWISFYRVMMGVLYAIILALPLGILCGCFKPIEAFIQPLCEFIRYMPVPSLVPLVMIFTGIGETSKIVVIFLGTFFQMVLMISDDVSAISNDLINASYTLGASKLKAIFTVVIPASIPRFLKTLRMLVGWAWTYLVVAELISAEAGLGYSILRAQRFMHMEDMYAGILYIGLIGLIIDRIFAVLDKILFPWAEDGE